jgi:hypothetical protein
MHMQIYEGDAGAIEQLLAATALKTIQPSGTVSANAVTGTSVTKGKIQ